MVYILEYAISYVNIYPYIHADYLTKRKKLDKPPSGESTAAIVSRYAQFDMYRWFAQPFLIGFHNKLDITTDDLNATFAGYIVRRTNRPIGIYLICQLSFLTTVT